MTIQEPIEGQSPSTSLICPCCTIELPPQATFCSSCGKRVTQQKNDEAITQAENDECDIQGQNDKTIRLPNISRKYWMRWLSYQKDKDEITRKLSDDHISQQQKTQVLVTEPLDKAVEVDLEVEQDHLSLPSQPGQLTPDTEVSSLPQKGMMIWLSLDLIWPVVIILSAIAVWFVNFVFISIPIRPLIVLWFLSICPGMVLIRFLRLKEVVVELVLAVALSFALEALITTVQLYAQKWSPEVTLTILIVLCISCAIAQLVAKFLPSISLPRNTTTM